MATMGTGIPHGTIADAQALQWTVQAGDWAAMVWNIPRLADRISKTTDTTVVMLNALSEKVSREMPTAVRLSPRWRTAA